MIRKRLVRVTLPQPMSRVVDFILRELPSVGLSLERQEPEAGRLWAKGIMKAFDMVVWRCWADRFLFEIKEIRDSETEVEVSMVVNLLRYKVTASDRRKMVDPIAVAQWVRGLGIR